MQDPTGLPEGPLREELGLLCASFSHSVADTLRVKTARAVKAVPGARALVVAGGVAANSMVRAMAAALAAERDLRLLLPSTGLCTDNAAMVAYTGELLARQGLCHGWDLEAIPRGRAVPDDYLRCV
jgi:N6-L-threonylcarbamoyladenine synthase